MSNPRPLRPARLAMPLALVAAAWMVLGGALVLAMNQWPAPARLWAPRLGWLGAGGCALALGAVLLPLG